ncbi:phosphotriesterase [Streptomyces sp. NPDC048491]|uniref:phosphotriesterase family protein n=1 Tax=Streptomyces TaxID=1883 RepID=UPI000C275EFA|nr:phosphotriesterase [Streptomyces sp. CB01201]MBX7464833.1 phosphotriesterase [Streptomyces sp. MAG02]PJN04561.1 phosphotriesterase [Streptomyces sp. CB01201]
MVSAAHTVLGEVAADRLGVVDAHDHLFIRSPRLPGQEMDDVEDAAARLAAFGALGGGAVVQWTPYGMGRRIAELPALSRESGVHIIAATGLHQAAHYTDALLASVRDRLAELFVSELTDGIGETGVRAGLIKVAGGFHGLDEHAVLTLRGAADAHRRTGAPIAVHLELGTGALDVLDLLCGELGVAPGSVILGHLNRSPDFAVHRLAAGAGANLAFDGPSRANHATDWRMPDALRALADAGFADRLLLGGDTVTPDTPGMPHLLRRVAPRLELDLGKGLLEQILITNPARVYAW